MHGSLTVRIRLSTVRCLRAPAVRANRHVPTESAHRVLRSLRAATEEVTGAPLTMAGYYAIDSLRIEKGYRAFGHELSPDDSPLEAGQVAER